MRVAAPSLVTRALPGRLAGPVAWAAVLALTFGGLAAVAGPAAVPASAAEQQLRCDAVYLARADGGLDRVDVATGASSAVVPGSGSDRADAVAVTRSGRAVEVVGGDVVEHGSGASSAPVAGGVDRPVGGAVDPTSGLYWYGAYRGSTFVLHAYDPATHAVQGASVRVKVPSAPGHEGDLAIDTAGHAYLVASSAKKASLYVAALRPTVGAAVAAKVTAVKVRSVTVRGAVTGLAFASDGFLYASTARTLQRMDPLTGKLGTTTTLAAGVEATDLGSCATPSTLSAQTALPDGRLRSHDQFRVSVSGGGLEDLPKGLRPVGTTSGTGRGVQDQDSDEVAGPTAVLPGQVYAIASRGTGRTDDRRYVSSAACVDASGRAVATSGTGPSWTVTAPQAPAGPTVVCTVSHAVARPALSVTQTSDPAAVDHAGQIRTLTAKVQNTGDTALEDLAVADSLTGLPRRTCSPTGLGQTLPVGAITTCTTTVPTTQADLDASAPATDTTTVAAVSAKRLGGVPASASVATRLAVAGTSTLSVAVSTTPAVVARTGQQLTYAVTVASTGNQTVRDVVTSAVAPGLPALTCTPVAQGGALAPGASTVCSATRTSDQDDLRAGGRTVSASAAGLGPTGAGVVAGATTKTGVVSTPPKAVDDEVTVAYGTSPVTVVTSRNDAPGEPDGPALDVTRTVLLPLSGPADRPGKRYLGTSHGVFSVRLDGSVLYEPATQPWNVPPVSGYTESIRYRTFDVAGQSAVATLRVVVFAGPVARPDTATGLQGDRLSDSPLKNDSPGQNLDGSRATFDPGSLRFTDDQPEGTGVVSVTGDTLSIPFVGTLAVVDGTVTFDPEPVIARTVTVRYAVTDSTGGTARSTITFTVTPVVPTTVADAVSTTFDVHSVTLAGTTNDSAGAAGRTVTFESFLGRDGATTGSTYVTGQGRWYGPYEWTQGRITFEPAVGFSGVATAQYLARTDRGGTAPGNLSVTVRPGPTVHPAVLSTTRGVAKTVDPTVGATASQHADGSPGHFVVKRTTFDVANQPTGAEIRSNGTSLWLPGRGTVRIAAGTGLVTFEPLAGFTGYAGRIQVGLENDDSGFDNVIGTRVSVPLTLLVTSDAPVATDDRATTVPDRSVTLPGATDDDPGTATTGPLTIVFPTTGQPAGSVVSSGGKKLTDPEEGVWTVNTSGTVTFAPAHGFVDATSPVAYRVQGAGGRTDTADLQVTVAPGATAVSDVLTRPQTPYYLQVDPLANDIPGRNADGTLGTIDQTTVTFPPAGQPAGTSVIDDGRTALVPLPGSGPDLQVIADPVTGLVGMYLPSGFRGTLPTVRYSVESVVTDSTGVTRRQTVSAALTVEVVGRDPVAVDDHVTVASGQQAIVPGPSNDLPTSALVGIDPYSTTFPVSQVGDLPEGSKVDFYGGQNEGWWEATVPGEGYWRAYWSDTFVTFQPVPGFQGTTHPLIYEVSDTVGNLVRAKMTVTVRPPAKRVDDVGSTRQGAPVTVDVLANDTPAPAADGTPQPDPDPYFDLAAGGQPKGATLEDGDLVVPQEGTYRADGGSGQVRFSPVPAFHGTTTPVVLTIGDQRSTLRVVVAAVKPSASSDDATSRGGAPVRVAVLDNDAPGTASRGLVASSVRLRTTSDLPTGSALSKDGQVLAVAGEGVFAVAGDGTLTGYPASNRSRTLPVVGYLVSDVNATVASSTVTVVVVR